MAEIMTVQQCETLSNAIDVLRDLYSQIGDTSGSARVAAVADAADGLLTKVLIVASVYAECENAEATLNAREQR